MARNRVGEGAVGIEGERIGEFAPGPAEARGRSWSDQVREFPGSDQETAGGIDRFPEYRPLLEQAERPAFVLVTDEPEPDLERTLRSMGVSFVERRLPPFVLIIPTSRKVHPSEVTPALDYRY